MSKEFGSETIEGISSAQTPPNQAQNQFQVSIDDSHSTTTYSSTCRVSGTAEEVNLDFGGALRPTGARSAVIRIDHRIILSPWSAKRLALLLQQTVTRYEQTYGVIELDERRRRLAPPAEATPAQ